MENIKDTLILAVADWVNADFGINSKPSDGLKNDVKLVGAYNFYLSQVQANPDTEPDTEPATVQPIINKIPEVKWLREFMASRYGVSTSIKSTKDFIDEIVYLQKEKAAALEQEKLLKASRESFVKTDKIIHLFEELTRDEIIRVISSLTSSLTSSDKILQTEEMLNNLTYVE